MQRDKHVDVMMFWGIIFVVMGHIYQLPFFFFPAYHFHIGLFFFISGYLFSVRIGVFEKIKFIKKKILSQLLPYFIFNILFFGLSYLLSVININVSRGFSLKNFFIEPFFSGSQNYFIVPMWFLISLFIVNVVMQILYINNSKINMLIVSVFVILFSLFCAYKGLNHLTEIKLLIARTGLCLLFFQTGIIVKRFNKIVNKLVLNPLSIIVIWAVVIFLSNNYGNIDYAILTAYVGNTMFYIPLITTILITLISYSICYHISNILDEKSLILLIGKNSFWIMSLHLLVFFIINSVFYKLNLITITQLSTLYYAYDITHTFQYYLFFGIAVPVVCGNIFSKFKILKIFKNK